MQNYSAILLATLICSLCLLSEASLLPSTFSKYRGSEIPFFVSNTESSEDSLSCVARFRVSDRSATSLSGDLDCRWESSNDIIIINNIEISNKEIHLKHGKLHAHHDVKQNHEEDHVVYKYRWLGDDIVKTENDFEGEEDDEYADKEGKVKLPGGCELTEKQYLELESFKKETYYVKKCYCDNGDVYCQINRALFKHKIV